jgi:hypothetical protein
MKKRIVLIMLGIAVIGGLGAQSLRGRTMYVMTKTAELRASTGFLADTLAILEYGDQVTVLQESGKWLEARWTKRPSLTGWISASSLTTRRIVSSGGGASASADELALAGKGFSAEVENSYKEDARVNYAAIDAMEAQRVSKQEIYDFLVEGRLITGE